MKHKGFVAISYALLFLLFSFPLIQDFSSSIVGSGPDPYQYIWNAFIFDQELSNASSPFHTDMVAFPEGVSLWMHTYTPIMGMLNFFIGNPYLSVNIILLLSFIFSGLGAYLLARRYGISKLAAWICGFIFAFAPYKTAHLLEHYHLMLTGAVPFFILYYQDAIGEEGLTIQNWKWKPFLWMSLCFLITFFSDYYTSFFLIFFVLLSLLFHYSKDFFRSLNKWRLLGFIAFIWLISHFILEKLYFMKVDDKGAMYNSPDLLSWLVPAPNSWLYAQGFWQNLRDSAGQIGPNEQVLFLGFGLSILFILVLFRAKSRHMQLLFLSIAFMLLCVPKMRIASHSITYSPTAFIHYIPFLNNIRNPGRFVAMVALFLPIFTFYSLEVNRLFSKWKWWLGIFAFVMIIELKPQAYPIIARSDVPQELLDLDLGPSESIWHIPTGYSDGFRAAGTFDTKYLQEQMEHKHSLLGVYISRLESEYFSGFKENQVFQYFNQESNRIPNEEELESFLTEFKPGCILVEKHRLEEDPYILQKIKILLPFKSMKSGTKYNLYYLDTTSYNSTK
ncbi:hypothetical protein GYB22_06015 [bacterium]|nr:hypothetical protein [bacterium]